VYDGDRDGKAGNDTSKPHGLQGSKVTCRNAGSARNSYRQAKHAEESDAQSGLSKLEENVGNRRIRHMTLTGTEGSRLY